MSVVEVGSVDRALVLQAINDCLDGDTVVMGEGEAAWALTVKIPTGKGITLAGKGRDKTRIIDAVPKSSTASPYVLTASPGDRFLRLRDFTLDQSMGEVSPDNKPMVVVSGSRWRLDHLDWRVTRSCGLAFYGSGGVIDHCDLDLAWWRFGMYGFNGGGSFGDAAWAETPAQARARAVTVEDCLFTCDVISAAIDGWAGMCVRLRRNRFLNTFVANHGLDSTGRSRSMRLQDVIDNEFEATTLTSYTPVHFRGGTGIVTGNVATGKWPANTFGMFANLRDYYYAYAFGGANGLSPWDETDGVVHDSGTHTGPAATYDPNQRVALTDASKNWATNQWTGYAVLNKTSGRFGLVLSNTAFGLIAATDPSQSWATLSFNTGDVYELRYVGAMIDQCGSGQGVLLSGDYPNAVPKGWPKQATEPIYAWNNTLNGSVVGMWSKTPRIKLGRDYFNGPASDWADEPYPHPLTNDAPPPPPPPIPDTVPPIVAITLPVEGAVLVGVVTVAVQAVDDVAVENVTVLVDGVEVGLDGTAPYGVLFNTIPLLDGPHVLTAKARDAAGNEALDSVNVIVDNVPAEDVLSPEIAIALTGRWPKRSVKITVTDNVAIAQVAVTINGVLTSYTPLTTAFTQTLAIPVAKSVVVSVEAGDGVNWSVAKRTVTR